MSDLELREKVARLMGNKTGHGGVAQTCYDKLGADVLERHHPHLVRKGKMFFFPLPAYETNIADAWEVVGFMREKYPGDTAPPAWVNFWEAGFFEDDARTLWRLSAEKAATAICKAFVAAMEANHDA